MGTSSHGAAGAVFGDLRLPLRFWRKVQPNAITTCWEWIGARVDGYGMVRLDGKMQLVHRVAYGSLIGAIPNDLVLDHLCRATWCCNPSHLEPVTNRENLLRGLTLQATYAARTHCESGHPFDAANTYVPKNGRGRYCRTCARDRERERYATDPDYVAKERARKREVARRIRAARRGHPT